MADDGPVNLFWARVQDGAPGPAAAAETGRDLVSAAREAWRCDDLVVAFRRNRELIDAHGRFRRFAFDGDPHIAKVTTIVHAHRERSRATLAAEHLAVASDHFVVPVPTVVPLDAELAALVLPDYGRTLAETELSPDARLSGLDVLETVHALIRHGVFWGGFAPRNICLDAQGRLVFLDLEDAAFAEAGRSISELTVRFWALNWARSDQDAGRLRQDLRRRLQESGIDIRWHDPDEYELEVARQCQADDRRAQLICAGATEEVWRPLLPEALHPAATLTAGDVSHLLDDVLNTRAAARALLVLAEIRQRDGEARYAELLYAIESLVADTLADAGSGRRIRPDTSVLDGLAGRLFGVVRES